MSGSLGMLLTSYGGQKPFPSHTIAKNCPAILSDVNSVRGEKRGHRGKSHEKSKEAIICNSWKQHGVEPSEGGRGAVFML